MTKLLLPLSWKILGTLRSNDADGNKNVKKKKTIGLISKTTTLHVHHAFFRGTQREYSFKPLKHIALLNVF